MEKTTGLKTAVENAQLTDSVENEATPEKAAGKKAAESSTAKKKPAAKKTAAASKAATKKTSGKKTAASKTSGSKTASKATTEKAASKTTTDAAATSEATSARKPVTSKKVAKKAANKIDDESITADVPEQDQDDDQDSGDSSNALTRAPVPYERVAGHYMDAEQLVHFSKKLAEWKQQLMEEVDRTVGHMKDDATNFPDPNDRATQEEEFSLELRTRDRERKLIKKINEAQKRIDDDEYGYCETCGIEIGVNRLEARPTAELCIDCKTLEEIRERQNA